MHRRPRPAAPLVMAAFLLLASCRGGAALDTAPAIGTVAAPASGATSGAIDAHDLRVRLFAFAHDSMMGREAGTLGNAKAADYIASEFRRLGLEPAGENGGFFQTVPMVERRLASSLLVAGGETLAAGADYIPLPAAGFLPFGGSGSLDGAAVVYGGRLGDERSLAAPESVAGKLVVVAPALGANGRPLHNFWSHRDARRFAGAAAVAVVSLEETPVGVRGFFTRPQTIVVDPADASTRPIGLVVGRRAAERLLGTPIDAAQPGAPGRAATVTVEFEERAMPFPVRNVVAVLRGSDPAVNGQYIAIGAHNDHDGVASRAVDHDSLRAFNSVMAPLGANSPGGTPSAAQGAVIRARLDSLRAIRPPRPDSIYNGADDDGSGTVAMLEVAEFLAGASGRLRRSVLFVSHAAEEKGLYGSLWFTDHPTVPRDSIVAQLNMDMVGRGTARDIERGGPNYLQIIGSRRLSTQLGDVVDSTNAALPAPFVIDYSFDARGHPLNRYCRSDHYSYARHGIPIAYFSRGYHIDYHMPTDEPQYIDYDGLAKVSRLIAEVATALADRAERLVVDGPVIGPDQPCRQ